MWCRSRTDDKGAYVCVCVCARVCMCACACVRMYEFKCKNVCTCAVFYCHEMMISEKSTHTPSANDPSLVYLSPAGQYLSVA